MAHQTRAGLYVVLPHNADKSLFVYPGKGEVCQEKDWEEFNHTSNDFMISKTYQKRKEGKPMTYASTLSKIQYDSKSQMGVKIDVSYICSQQGKVSSLRIGYDLIRKKEL